MRNIQISLVCCLTLMGISSYGQLSLSGQLRTRTEFRDGQGAPPSEGSKPALFTSQRTRLNALFKSYRLQLGASLQDVRVWGQDVSTINRTTIADNNGLMLHEAWAEIQLTDTTLSGKALSLKVGRQELVYDDQRLIGNLDWLQQARRHDAAVLKYETDNWTLHLATAFNQNKEKSSGTVYNSTPPGNYTASTNGGSMYKSMEFLYAKRKFKGGSVSFLFFSDQFNPYDMDSINIGVKNYTTGSWSRATTGLYLTRSAAGIDFSASAYHQFGKSAAGKKINAQLFSVSALYTVRKVAIGGGIDYTSVDFDPLYGTPHKFWGLMDFFYAASPSGNHGLVDYYLKSRWKANDKLLLSADLHHFAAATAVPGFSKTFGQEIDVVASYSLTRQINIEGGYSHFFTAPALSSATVKNVPDARAGANWAYIMINIRPDFLFK